MEIQINQIFTDKYPPEAAVWCNKNNAYIKEIESSGSTRRFQIVTVSEPTEEEKQIVEYQTELREKEQWLTAHDYIGVKIATGRATVDDYAAEIATMTEYAARVEELRALIAELESK